MTIAFRRLLLPLPPSRHKQQGRVLEAFFYFPFPHSQTRQGRDVTVFQCLFKNQTQPLEAVHGIKRPRERMFSLFPRGAFFPFKKWSPSAAFPPHPLRLAFPPSVSWTRVPGSHLHLISVQMHTLSKGTWVACVDGGMEGACNCFISFGGFLTSLMYLSESPFPQKLTLKGVIVTEAPTFAEVSTVSPWYPQVRRMSG